MVEALLKQEAAAALVEQPLPGGWTPLLLAASEGVEGVAELLLQKGADAKVSRRVLL